MSLLSACDVHYQVGDKALLDGVNLTLQAGDKVVLIGRSGSGKSLLLQALADLLPLESSADICLRGESYARIAPAHYRAQVALIHQMAVFDDGTVADNLRAPYHHRYYQGRQFDASWHIDKLAGLGKSAGFMDKHIHELSGGERQLVNFLRTLQFDPLILLVDEATSALDSDTADALIQLVLAWHDNARALLWVTHTPSEAEQLGAHLWRMDAGRLDVD